MDFCAGCNKPGGVSLSACTRCRTVAYCSKDCQRTHWKSGHKQACAASTPPSRSDNWWGKALSVKEARALLGALGCSSVNVTDKAELLALVRARLPTQEAVDKLRAAQAKKEAAPKSSAAKTPTSDDKTPRLAALSPGVLVADHCGAFDTGSPTVGACAGLWKDPPGGPELRACCESWSKTSTSFNQPRME
jgi:hypothetical protein